MIDNKLRIIDFSAAIQSQPLNFNYKVIHGWMQRERLRTGGYGLVEGFELSYDYNFNINVTEGILIDKKGDEIIVDSTTMACAHPEYETITERAIVDEEGRINLKHSLYSPTGLGLITYKYPVYTVRPKDDEVLVTLVDNGQKLRIVTVEDNRITVAANENTINKEVEVRYLYCNDRIDAILVDENGEYTREIGINSMSPSAADLNMGDRFLIGFAHWIVGEQISVEFIVDERTYRKVYVDTANRLYLNGKLYEEKTVIYFNEPQNPQENDIWYDSASNTMNIWSYDGGVWGWRIMNDFTNVPLRSSKIWLEKDNPKDLQTFLFDESETNLRFTPGINALEIRIDQQIVMSDQFTEVVMTDQKKYLSNGIGFRLIEPLDRESVVECIVHHNVKNAPLKNVFQRAAIFIDENFVVHTASNTNKVFHTELEYVVGANQIEVFVDGVRLNPETEFVEMINSNQQVTAADIKAVKTTRTFKVLKTLNPGQKVTYKLSRYVWSYDQLNQMTDEIENKADTALKRLDTIEKENANVVKNLTDQMANLNTQITNLKTELGNLSTYRKTTDKIKISDLDVDAKAKLVYNTDTISFNASNVGNTIDRFSRNDYLVLVLINATGTRILQENAEYSLTYNSNGSATINLLANLMSPANTVYASIIRFGAN